MIGKRRQTRETLQVEEKLDPAAGKARGILRGFPPAGKFGHMRQPPPQELAPWIEHYWMVTWNLGRPFQQETLPHPNIYLVFENEKCVIAGVSTKKFSRLLEGKSGVFGVKFKPGGFRPFSRGPVSTISDRVVPAKRIFGSKANDLEAAWISSAWQAEKMIEAGNAFFRDRLPRPDPKIDLVGGIVRRILQDREIKTVDDLVERTGLGKRKLQRIFQEYVGISPKWVIRRYRLHELVEVLTSGEDLDWSQVALDLGYFDQAHLINDFKSIAGHTPAQYQKLGQ